MSVDTQRQEYVDALPVWDQISDCVDGQAQVKSKSTEYLPMMNPSDQSKENQDRYLAYLQRAIFYGVTGRTAEGLQAMLYNEAPTNELGGVDYLALDVDGSGISIGQQSKRTAKQVVELGRAGLLVDMPETNGAVTRRDVNNGTRANIQQYEAQDIINWRTEKVGAVRKLTLVVLREDYDSGSSMFTIETKQQYRVLALEDGLYTQQLFREGVEEGEKLEPRNGTNKRLDYIPFTFVGAENNDDVVDQAPMESISNLNVGHYINSADHEDALHLLAPTLFIFTDISNDEFKERNPNGIMMGSVTGHVLRQGDTAQIIEPKEKGAYSEEMRAKEQQMIALGAKLIEPNAGNKTAYQARSDNASETSILSDIGQNISDAYTQAVKWVAAFMNESEDDLFFKLSDDFGIDELTVEARRQLLAEWQSGLIPKRVARNQLREAGVIDSEDEDEALDEEIANEGGGLDLDG